MATFIGIRSFVKLILAFEQNQRRLRFDRARWKSTFSWALGTSFCLLAVGLVLPAGAQSAGTDAQTHEWAWMGGSNLANQPGVYRTLDTPAAENLPGGRYCQSRWTDSSGNVWLFGGIGYDSSDTEGTLNDLWEFNPSTQEWTWMGGSSTVPNGSGQSGVYGTLGAAAAANLPGGRYCANSWTDSSGNLWLFGGEGYDSTGTEALLNDLWEFNPSTHEWAWMGGISTAQEPGVEEGVYGTLGTPAAENFPGVRAGAVSWTDSSGNFWLFGGGGADSTDTLGQLNDLWEFNPSTREWAWMGGSSTAQGAKNAVYGTMGTPAAGNVPGGRQEAVSWTDSSGNLWLFGGGGADSAGTNGELNDLWEFNPSTREWAWMSGSSTVPGDYLGQPGVYGALGVPATGNVPGGRSWASSWTDSSGNLWLFGGIGYDSKSAYGYLNDLWEFYPSTREWAWMGGSSTVPNGSDQPGVYGALGTSAAGNLPGGRYGATSWTDSNGNFWLFGGMGYDSTGTFSEINDLWEQGTPVTPASSPVFSPPAGTYTSTQSVTISDTTPGATIYYTTNGTTPTTSSATYTGAITVSSTETMEAIAAAAGYANSAAATARYTITPPAATPTFSPAAGTYTSTQSVTISDTTPGAMIYYTTNGTTPTSGSARYTGAITVSSTETMEAIVVASGYVSSPLVAATYKIQPTNATYSMSATAVTAALGEPDASTVTVSSTNGYAGTVTLTCAVTSSPAGAIDLPTCSSSPKVTLSSGTASATATVTVNTTAASDSAMALPKPGNRWAGTTSGAVLALLVFLWIPAQRRRWWSMLSILAVIAALGGLAGCNAVTMSGKSAAAGTTPASTPGTTAGTYTITVSGTGNDSASTTAATTFVLTVN